MRTCINGATTRPYSLAEDIVSAAGVKFEGIEIWYEKLKEYLAQGNSFVELREVLGKSKLEPAALCGFPLIAFSHNEQILQEVIKASQIGREINCHTLLVFPGDIPPAEMDKTEVIKQAADSLRTYAEAIMPYNAKIAFEPMGMHPYVPGPKEALEIVECAGSKNLGIMIDTFHYYKSGVSREEIKGIPLEKLFIVHVNDCQNLPRQQLTDAHRLYPGLGIIPLVEEFKILKEKGYKGFLSVEIFRKEYWKESCEKINREAKKNLDIILSKV